MTALSEVTCFSTPEVVVPETESFVAVTACPLVAASPSALSGGYGLQSQFAPRGTESPRATIDHVRAAVLVVAEGVAVEVDVPPHAESTAQNVIRGTTAPARRQRMARPL